MTLKQLKIAQDFGKDFLTQYPDILNELLLTLEDRRCENATIRQSNREIIFI